jgi:predicted AlkP superfamily pyrophosphatase or phosphodiesterase
MKYYDPKKNLVSISSSLLKAFGIEPFHPSYLPLDRLLKKEGVPQKRKLCLILLDGFGTAIQEIYKKEAKDIYEHKKFEITSVFPPTTVAATTSLLTDRYPIESGWMGWTQKFPEYSTPVTMFPSTFIGGDEKTPTNTYGLVPIDFIDSMINRGGVYKASRLMGFLLDPATTDNFAAAVNQTISYHDFTYAYWFDPDATLHAEGTHSPIVASVAADLNAKVVKLASDNPDVLFLVLADHGHIDTKYFSIYEHDDLYSTLRNRAFSLEPRAAVFYVKDAKKEEFLKLAKKYYGAYFDIYSAQEVKEQKLFGEGNPNKYFDEFIGDFLLVAKAHYAFAQDTTANDLKSHHAGGTKAERYINIAVFNAKAA